MGGAFSCTGRKIDEILEELERDGESGSGESRGGESGSGESGGSESDSGKSDSGKSDSDKSVWQENGFKDKFFKFSGRLNRKQYITRALPIWLMSIVMIVFLILIYDSFSTRKDVIMFSNVVVVILSIPMGISHLSLLKRRWQDLGKSSWWILTCFLPPVFAYLILFKKGTSGENKYGPAPLGVTANDKIDSSKPSRWKSPKKILASLFAVIMLLALCIFIFAYNAAHEHNNKGISYLNEQQYDKALTEFNQAIKLNSRYADAYYHRGFVYCKKNDYDKALIDFNRVIELDLNYVEAYCFRGVAYSRKKNYDKALLDFKRALELDPEYPKVYCVRCPILSRQILALK